MISASKSTLSQNNIKILRPKVTNNVTNFHKKFCESLHRVFAQEHSIILICKQLSICVLILVLFCFVNFGQLLVILFRFGEQN